MMQTFAATFNETGDHAVRSQRFEEFDPDRTGPKEGHTNALIEDLLGRFRFEAEDAIVRQGRIEPPDRDSDMMDRTDHTSCLGRYMPKADRSTSLISPSVDFARTASRTAGIVFSLPRAMSSRRRKLRVAAFAFRPPRNVLSARARSAANFGFVLATGIFSLSSVYAFTPTTVRSPRSSSI